MTTLQGLKFEDNIAFIDAEIAKRRNLWNLSSVQWMDFEDVSQIIRLHVYEKWHLYDQSKPLGPWLNKVIAHQIKNLIRNIYGNYARPCLKCAAAEPDNLCKIYSSQCADCPLYAAWEKNKKRAYDIKIPLSLETFENDAEIGYHDEQNIDTIAAVIHAKMKEELRPIEWTIYKLLFIDNLSEEEAATRVGYKSNEANRRPGYKQIRNIRKAILKKVKIALANHDIDIL